MRVSINNMHLFKLQISMQIHPSEQNRIRLHLASNFLGGRYFAGELSHIPRSDARTAASEARPGVFRLRDRPYKSILL